MRSTAVLANTARSRTAGSTFSISSRSNVVALIAFSQAITARGAAASALSASASAISGATKRRMFGPTAVVTTSAVAISATISFIFVGELGVDELIARKPVTV